MHEVKPTICPHDTITKDINLAIRLTRASLFVLGLSAMPSNLRFFRSCIPFSHHSLLLHLYLRHHTAM